MISTFASPLEFIKLFNKSVGVDNAFGSEFMNYLEEIDLKKD